MANVKTYDMTGKETGSMELDDNIFGVRINEHLIHLAVTQYLADNRQGTQKAKTRSEVSGGGRKPHRRRKSGYCRSRSGRRSFWRPPPRPD